MLLRHTSSQLTVKRPGLLFSVSGGLLQLSVIYRATNAALVSAAYSLFVILSGVFFWLEVFVL